jgi:hypothetical protein
VSPSSGLDKEQLDTPASDNDGREAERLAALDHLNAIRPETDHILQQLADEVRSIFGTDLCMVNLNLSDVQYFRAWSGELPAELAEARQDALEHSMCQYVVDSEMPLVVKDFSATEEFREQHWCVNYGIHFYAGTPLITSDSHAIGTLCLLNAQPIEFGKDQMRVLGGFAQAVVGRLELLGALGREQDARKEEALRSEDRQRTLDSLSAHIAIIDGCHRQRQQSLARLCPGKWISCADLRRRRQLPPGMRFGSGRTFRGGCSLCGGDPLGSQPPAQKIRARVSLPFTQRTALVHWKGDAFCRRWSPTSGDRPRKHHRAQAGRGEAA